MATVILAAGLVACSSGRDLPDNAAFQVGMERSDVLARFGPPDRKRVLVRSVEPVWGPIEGFWASVEEDSEIEIWYYRSRARLDSSPDGLGIGTTELYFVDGSVTVQGTGFDPDGVNY